jgi:hypothetical protein
VSLDQLAPDEPLSPELVLVFTPELRAQALAGLPAPIWATMRPRASAAPSPAAAAPLERSVGAMVVARVAHLALIFVAVTILTLAMSLVAQAVR